MMENMREASPQTDQPGEPISADHQPLLRLQDAGRTFRMGEVQVRALADDNLPIQPGEHCVILGRAGRARARC